MGQAHGNDEKAQGILSIFQNLIKNGDDLNYYKCDVCNRDDFETDKALANHVANSHREKKFKCDFCRSTFMNEMGFKRHLKKHEKAKAKIVNAEMDFGEEGMQMQTPQKKKSTRPSPDGKLRKCRYCDFTTTIYKTMWSHEDTHRNLNLSCKICDKKMPSKRSLSGHMYACHTEKPYKCEFCGKGFILAENLSSHLNHTHKGLKKRVINSTIYEEGDEEQS